MSEAAFETADPSRPTQGLLRKLGPTGLLAIFWCAFPAVCGLLLIGYAQTVTDFLHARGTTASILIYTTVFIISAGLGLLPTYSQSALAGWCFGLGTGFPAAWVGFAGASLVGYLFARTVSRHRVQDLIQTNPKARAVHETLVGHGFLKTLGLVTLLRLPPNSPFAIMNLVMSSTGVPLAPFLIGTVVGMAPRTAAAVYLGTTVKSFARESINSAIPPWIKIGGIALSLAILAAIGVIADKAVKRVSVAQGPRCQACGYSLAGLREPICPECGAAFAETAPQSSEVR